MRKGLLVMLTIGFFLVPALPGCGQKEQAEQETEAPVQLEEQAEIAPEIEEPEDDALSSTSEEEMDLEETNEGPHGRTFDEGEEIEDREGVYEEEPVDEEELEEEPLPEDTEDE